MASQPIAVLLPVAWFLLLESYAGALARDLSPWLPGQLTSALANTGDLAHLLPVWVGGLGLVGYGLLLLGLGADAPGPQRRRLTGAHFSRARHAPDHHDA